MSTARLLQQEQKHFKEELCTPGFQGRMQKTSSSSDRTKDLLSASKDAAMRARLEIVRAPKVKHSVYMLPGDMRHLLKRLLMSTASLLQQQQKHFKEKICTPGSQDRMQKTSSSSSDNTNDYFLQEQKHQCKKSSKS